MVIFPQFTEAETEGRRVKQPIQVFEANKQKTMVEISWNFFILLVYQSYNYRFMPFRYQTSCQIQSLHPMAKLQRKYSISNK